MNEREGLPRTRHGVGTSPLPDLFASAEPSARWVTLSALLGGFGNDPGVAWAHEEVLARRGVVDLLARLPDWEVPS